MSVNVASHRPSSQGDAAGWEPGPARPRLAAGEVHVWAAQLSRLRDLEEVLSEAERARAREIVSDRRRLLWARSRRALRVLLARYLGTAPAQVPLALDANGKPCLPPVHDDHQGPHGAQKLHFNLSHSVELALYAFSSSWPVGIDVERTGLEGHRRDRVAVARRVFGENEARRLRALSAAAREREFLRLWTRHEAILKRHGRGIGAGASDLDGSAWIVELDLGAEAVAALAGERPASALRAWSFD